MKVVFETETCTRCGGTGEHLYNEKDGTTCFKCCGTKKTLTKVSLKSKKDYDEKLLEVFGKKAIDIKPGDVIIKTSKQTGKKYWATVVSVDVLENQLKVNGEWTPQVEIEAYHPKYGRSAGSFNLDCIVRIKYVPGGDEIIKDFCKALNGCMVD